MYLKQPGKSALKRNVILCTSHGLKLKSCNSEIINLITNMYVAESYRNRRVLC